MIKIDSILVLLFCLFAVRSLNEQVFLFRHQVMTPVQ